MGMPRQHGVTEGHASMCRGISTCRMAYFRFEMRPDMPCRQAAARWSVVVQLLLLRVQ